MKKNIGAHTYVSCKLMEYIGESEKGYHTYYDIVLSILCLFDVNDMSLPLVKDK